MGAATHIKKSVLSITVEAIKRRLLADGAELSQVWSIVYDPPRRKLVEGLMLSEWESSRKLGDWGSEVFSHFLDIPEDDHGEYYLVDRFVCYVVHRGIMTTTIVPTDADLDDIAWHFAADTYDPSTDGEPTRESGVVRIPILQSVCPSPIVHTAPALPDLPEPVRVPRSKLVSPRWLKPGKVLNLLVPDPDVAPEKAARMLRRKLFALDSLPNGLVLLERGLDTMDALSIMLAPSHRARVRDVPSQVRSAEHHECGHFLPQRVVRGWQALFDRTSPGRGACTAVVSEHVARILLALLGDDDRPHASGFEGGVDQRVNANAPKSFIWFEVRIRTVDEEQGLSAVVDAHTP